MIASASISRVPKRELSTVTVDIVVVAPWVPRDEEDGAPDQRRKSMRDDLDDAGPRAEGGLVGGGLGVELDQGLGDVGVLGLRELTERRTPRAGRAGRARPPGGWSWRRWRRGPRAGGRSSCRAGRGRCRAAPAPSPARRWSTASRRTWSSLSSPAPWPSPRNSRPTTLIVIVHARADLADDARDAGSSPRRRRGRRRRRPRLRTGTARRGLGAGEQVAAAVAGVGGLLDRPR